MRAVIMSAFVVMCIPFVYSCTTARPCPPCPPAQVIEVKIPVPVPAPQPPAISDPVLWLPQLSLKTTTVEQILIAAEHDMEQLKSTLLQYKAALESYRTGPGR